MDNKIKVIKLSSCGQHYTNSYFFQIVDEDSKDIEKITYHDVVYCISSVYDINSYNECSFLIFNTNQIMLMEIFKGIKEWLEV